MHKRGKKLILLFLLMLIMFFGVNREVFAEEEKETLQVILVNSDAYGYITYENDVLGGYYVEYLEEISQYTGWEYEYRVVSDEDLLMSIVTRKDYDLMVGITYKPESEKYYFDYPNYPLVNREVMLATTKDHSELIDVDLQSLSGIKVGYVNTTYNQELIERFKSYCFSNNITYSMGTEGDDIIQLVEVPDDERFTLLGTGDVDAIFTVDSLTLQHNLYEAVTFGTTPMYIVEPRGRRQYIDKLNTALAAINNQDDSFEERLYDKYFAVNEQGKLVFSKEELAIMEKEQCFKVAMVENFAPYSYEHDGVWSGVAVEVCEEITRMTNGKISFEYVGYKNFDEATQAVSNGDVSIFGIADSFSNVIKFINNKSSTYYTDYFYMYHNKNVSEIKENPTFAVGQDFMEEELHKLGINNGDNIVGADSLTDTLHMVNEGEADFTVGLQAMAGYYTSYYRLENVSALSAAPLCECSFAFAYNDTVDSDVRKIINRCISYINEEDINSYISAVTLTEHKDFTLMDYIKANWSLVAILLIVVFSIACAVLAFGIRTIYKKSKRIYRMLYYDDVTDGISHLKFEEEVAKLAEEQPEKYYILFVDISSFKYINDVFGYDMGNQVLVSVEEFMQKLAGDYPHARMYADHFVGILPYEDKKVLSNRLRTMLGEFDKQSAKNHTEFNVFLKMGVYEWDAVNDAKADIMQIVNLANYATDSIKYLSKSEYRFYTSQLHDEILKQQEIEKDMHRAMEDGEFIAYYQSKYDIVTKKIIGAEALVRWKHKKKGLLPPGIFIPIFEKNGFVVELDFCVFTQVCEFIAGRIEKGLKIYPISCNFSREHFFREDFIERLMEIVELYKVPTEYIEIEITETIATSDFDVLVGKVEELKQNGFKISIDDFGSGYSCIQLLYKLPIDALKFDRVFVTQQNVNQKEEDINRSIIHICHNNNVKVICEGIETVEQQEYIKSYDCRYGQGYLYSKPVEKETFIRMLDENEAF